MRRFRDRASAGSGRVRSPGFGALVAGVGLFLTGATVLVDAGVMRLKQEGWQRAARRASAVASPRAPGRGASSRSAPCAAAPRRGDSIARIRLDRLGIDAMVVEGTDTLTLRLGPGHMQGSALPGEADNCIIAGHRDGAFRRLAGVKEGDRVRLEDAAGISDYRVVDVAVVAKEDARLLAPSRDPWLTLVTCYPIHYIGPAPRRLVVRATLVAGDREPALPGARTGS